LSITGRGAILVAFCIGLQFNRWDSVQVVITISSHSTAVGTAYDYVVDQTSVNANIKGSSGWASVVYVARAILRDNGCSKEKKKK